MNLRLAFCLVGEFVAGADGFANGYRLAAKKRPSFLSIFFEADCAAGILFDFVFEGGGGELLEQTAQKEFRRFAD